jgi:hypothetical protein
MSTPHEVHEGIMAGVTPAVHTALLLAMLLTEARRSMLAAQRQPPAHVDMPSVVSLANLAVRLSRAPTSKYVSIAKRGSNLHNAAMRVASQVASKMDAIGLGAPRFAPATFRVAGLGAAADSAEGLLYAALTCLHACLLGARHARDKQLYMRMLALVVYPGLEPLHPESLGALSDGMRHVAHLLLACVTQSLELMLAHEIEPDAVDACVASCVECRGAVEAHLASVVGASVDGAAGGPGGPGKTVGATLASLRAELEATLDVLEHFARL